MGHVVFAFDLLGFSCIVVKTAVLFRYLNIKICLSWSFKQSLEAVVEEEEEVVEEEEEVLGEVDQWGWVDFSREVCQNYALLEV